MDFIKEGSKFIIAGHKEPDGDCVGAQLALGSVLKRIGKDVSVCSAGPFKRPEVRLYEQFFVPVPEKQGKDALRLIIMDCSTLDRTGDLEPHLKDIPMAVIDHHYTAELSGIGPCFIDPKAPSTTFLVRKIIKALDLEPSLEEAELLFFGLCTDTGFFRHVDAGAAETFEAAADLIRFGANPRKTFLAINGGKSLDSRKFLAKVLLRAESMFNGKLVLSTDEFEQSYELGLKERDSDSFYQLIQSVAGVEAIVLLRQETREKCTVGLRSLSWVDMGAVAASFGGGGHKNAAGFSIEGTIEDIKPLLVMAFDKVFANSN